MRSHNSSPTVSTAVDSRRFTQRRFIMNTLSLPMLLALVISPFILVSGSVVEDAQPAIPKVLKDQGVEKVLTPGASTRIINGLEVQNERYPYAASLQYLTEHFCGACLIAPDIVITAGHCNGAISLSGIVYNAVLGRHNLEQFWDGQSIRIKEEVRHPEYDEDTINNDFNIVLLSRPVEGDVQILRVNDDPTIPAGPINLNGPPNNPNFKGDALTVVGWGDTDAREDVATSSNVLLETTVHALTNEQCERAEGMALSEWGMVWTDLKGGITENMVCAWAEDTDACQGDSGGPLIKKGDNPDGSEDTMIGIVSWGLGCADEAFPGVYARVSAQYDWIRSTVCDLSTNPPDYFKCPGFEPGLMTPVLPDAAPPNPTTQPTPLPTVPTTPSPTRSPVPDGKRRLSIKVQLDKFPAETGWRLTTLSNDVADAEESAIYEVEVGSYSIFDSQTLKEYEILVDDEAFYNLTIYDSAGNGFEGTLDVHEGDTLLVREPGFSQVSGTTVSHGFYAGSNPEQFLTLDFLFDGYAEEVAYEIKNDADGIIFALAWFKTFGTDDQAATVKIPIYGPKRGDQKYTMRLWDAGEDGICCSWGQGRYQLYLGDVETGLLMQMGGEYGHKETVQFTIEGDDQPTSSPTSTPTKIPTAKPTTLSPTAYPTTQSPTKSPSRSPSLRPTSKPIFLQLPLETPRLPATAPSSSSRDTEEIFPTSSPEESLFWTSSVSETEGAADETATGKVSNFNSGSDDSPVTPQVKNDTTAPASKETEPESESAALPDETKASVIPSAKVDDTSSSSSSHWEFRGAGFYLFFASLLWQLGL